MINKTWIMFGGGVAALVLAGAFAVAAADWRGDAGSVRTATRSSHSGSRHGGGHSSALLSLLRFDTNNDGKIVRAEIEAGILAEFQAIDTNRDGKIDAQEFHVYDVARRAERKARMAAWLARTGGNADEEPAPNREPFDSMKRLDWNLDGFVTPDEFGGRIRALAMRADRDGDGTILVEDLKNPPARGRRRSGDQARVTTASQ